MADAADLNKAAAPHEAEESAKCEMIISEGARNNPNPEQQMKLGKDPGLLHILGSSVHECGHPFNSTAVNGAETDLRLKSWACIQKLEALVSHMSKVHKTDRVQRGVNMSLKDFLHSAYQRQPAITSASSRKSCDTCNH